MADTSQDQPRITAAELVEVITKHPDWANLPVHMLNMTDDAVWLTEIEYDCFDVNEGPVLSLLAHAPAVPGGQPAPSYGVVLARAEDAERRADELLAEVEQLRASEAEMRTTVAALTADGNWIDRDTELERVRAQLFEATTLLGHFVDHEDAPCRLDHDGACQEHGGSSLRPCDVAAGRELLKRWRAEQ